MLNTTSLKQILSQSHQGVIRIRQRNSWRGIEKIFQTAVENELSSIGAKLETKRSLSDWGIRKNLFRKSSRGAFDIIASKDHKIIGFELKVISVPPERGGIYDVGQILADSWRLQEATFDSGIIGLLVCGEKLLKVGDWSQAA